MIPAAFCAIFSCNASADGNLFLPSEIKSSKKDSSIAHSELRSLCNEKLAERSEQIRSNRMSATHRALNYDWLSSYSEQGRQYHGGRAFGRMAQKMLREYWEYKRQTLGDGALLDEDGNLKQRNFRGVDYGLTTSGGGLNIGLNYTFE
ncbi:hypothetical protein QSV34_03100 [Porticoccus sp. W117]|uniref:hypothetical protein n=1 Tax=Porticoccus sp. W117 TaxID=3054777 RepID=UPI00259278F6|nr:hypothetical protein [Porticoccus sp. W117]MDM3870336.1 hypothetical protein [Porticoccus sp. W117]